MPEPDICVVMNAGSGKGEDAERVRAAFAALDVPVHLELVEDGSRLTATARQAIERGFGTVVAAGGDGTICAVAAAMAGSGKRMGILPLGTFNYFARSLLLPQELEPAVEVVCAGRTAPIRVATVNDQLFLNNASLGVYPAILETREEIYRRWGRSRALAYWSVLKVLARMGRPLKLRVRAGGEERLVRSPLVFVVNNAFQLEQMNLDGADRIAAGDLVVFIAPNTGRLGMFRNAAALALGYASVDQNYLMMSGPHVEIDLPQGRRRIWHVARDGERERMVPPFDLKAIEGAIEVTVPEHWDRDVR
ncbi:diacylglycerol kinase [Rhodobacter sphaeroides]|uniref:Sphingosine/diacylglycerol kinase-like enzyme n=1 Tax=Cereibacter sphaeroides (strain ATCC 17023 / DSM 158 / JCM 6121 / CCUG 31486 / LMG 2827 / NBRC 12203 / NCIMB 8253 / ATH 2.4.1.) TaxID=272943 RepID=Q3J121_CERS4|nr:diacylglycerol kinase family protein [Cereibacter sphaeroides]ABA79513.1 sphingosine/diacylglycerol kinase-like enzyme [Cereibacter sphaeroides 2.4.1]AMJ47803.1 diacylglycerol kinase [Cereibacter sphaeroides]ANS34512.1 diacylglycerol kinase [Cereibacter sphaeroides]ATN63560.1 diacylglycerol kinase [Cereibacter sphaeroides]AXC61725.1 diacylglycerol kinase [Cereibacter sphaeroides 2.4.1]